MRCTVRIPLSPSSRAETYCYAPLNDRGECSKHGPQWKQIAPAAPPNEELVKEKRSHDAEIARIGDALFLSKGATIEEIVEAIRKLRDIPEVER